MKTITVEELKEKLAYHAEWLKNPSEDNKLDLSGFDLSGFILSDVNLRGVNLSKSDLSYSDISNANLSGCDLSDTDLSNSDLSDANLSNTNLRRANLQDADLTYTNLDSSVMLWANMEGVKAYGASISSKTHLPDNVFHIVGYGYIITIINERIQVGCKNFTYQEWLKMTKKSLIGMDGRKALEFYPTLVKLIKFHYNLM